MDWDKLRISHAVASAGSFTHAGQMLTLSQSAVSRQISALEEEISTPLFQRHARGLTLTDEGELLYGAVSDVLARLAAAEEALKNIHDSPRGSLKITASHGIGAYWLLPRMQEFLKEFPEVEVHLVMDNYGTHKTPSIKAWFARHPRFHVHFTPTSASWLNQVERWFAALTEKYLRRGTHRSTRQLEDAIRHYLDVYNANPKPFVWSKSADEILASLERFCVRVRKAVAGAS